MPLYEYRCTHCNKDFEHRSNMAERQEPRPCPVCSEPSARIEMSVFAISASGATASSGSECAGDCAGGACANDLGGGRGCCGGACACAPN